MSDSLSPSSATCSSSDSASSSSVSTPSTSRRLSPLPDVDEGEVDLISGRSSPRRAFPAEADEFEVEADKSGIGRLLSDLGGPSPSRLLGVEAGEAEDFVGFDDVMLRFEAEKGDGSSGWLLVGAVDKGGGKGEKVADDCQMREREAEEVGVLLEACISRQSVGPDGWPTTVGDFEKRGKLRDGAEESHRGEGKEVYFDPREKTGGEAEGKHSMERIGVEAEKGVLVADERPRGRSVGEAERLRARTRAVNLAESLGLGSSSDSEEDGLCVSNFGAKEPLALMAVECQRVGYESGCGVESEGLTEEMGVMRREMLDPGMLDDEWRQKTLVLNGEEIANYIYHIPNGYRLHLPPEGSFIHGVYLKHLQFGLRFPLVDEIISRMGLSLGQLTPQSVRVIVAYVWVCHFFRVPPTVDLFRSLHHIAPIREGADYWMVVSEPGKLVVWPKKSSTKDWRGRFFFLSYPENEWPILRTQGSDHVHVDGWKLMRS